ncbi:hypothetical protein WN48_01826 [Eufriesea mexicana]|nr:hypothetical protein WN48_01826 [Eufriesea mexicana]
MGKGDLQAVVRSETRRAHIALSQFRNGLFIYVVNANGPEAPVSKRPREGPGSAGDRFDKKNIDSLKILDRSVFLPVHRRRSRTSPPVNRGPSAILGNGAKALRKRLAYSQTRSPVESARGSGTAFRFLRVLRFGARTTAPTAYPQISAFVLPIEATAATTAVAGSPLSWHIPRPSLVGRSERNSENGSWAHHLHPNSPSRGSTSSQGSTASTHSAASGTLLLTAANLANLAAIHPPTVTTPKQMDTASVASSTHFTVVNGLGRPTTVYRKSYCARNQLTVLVCTMTFLFMVGLLLGILYMESKYISCGEFDRIKSPLVYSAMLLTSSAFESSLHQSPVLFASDYSENSRQVPLGRRELSLSSDRGLSSASSPEQKRQRSARATRNE